MSPRGSAGFRCAGSARAFFRPGTVDRLELEVSTSLAIRAFNILWSQALNARSEHAITHAAMLHDDVVPDDGWLDVLLEEMERTGADMVSAVVPIKSGHGLTSTAVDADGAPWIVKRLTMAEVCNLPETFGLEDVGYGSQLLLNTGLWVCRFTEEWVEQVAFKDHARIVKLPNGEYQSQDISEDWCWSRQLNDLGLKLMATRKVGLHHERQEFHNRSPWGAWATDEAYAAHRAIYAEAV